MKTYEIALEDNAWTPLKGNLDDLGVAEWNRMPSVMIVEAGSNDVLISFGSIEAPENTGHKIATTTTREFRSAPGKAINAERVWVKTSNGSGTTFQITLS